MYSKDSVNRINVQCSILKPYFSDYASAIREVLFTTSLADLKKTKENYEKKCPGPMNQIFPDKIPKADAVTRYERRKSLQTKLEPAGRATNKHLFTAHPTSYKY